MTIVSSHKLLTGCSLSSHHAGLDQRSVARRLALITSLAWFAIIGNRCDAIDPVGLQQPQLSSELPADWTIGLDHTDYHRREATSNEIRAVGRRAAFDPAAFGRLIEELRGGLEHPSLDVRWQSTWLTKAMLADRMERQVALLRSRSFDDRSLQLPMWGSYQELLGSPIDARRLFCQMLDERGSSLALIERSQAMEPTRPQLEIARVAEREALCPFQVDANDDIGWCVLFLADAAEAMSRMDESEELSVSRGVGSQPHSRLIPGSLGSKLTVCLTNPSLGPTALISQNLGSLTSRFETPSSALVASSHDQSRSRSSRNEPNRRLLCELIGHWRDLRHHQMSDSQVLQISRRIDAPEDSNRLAEAMLENAACCPRTAAFAVVLRMSQTDQWNDCVRQPFWRTLRDDQRVVVTTPVKTHGDRIGQRETRVSDVLLSMTARKLGKDPREIGVSRLTADPVWTYEISSLGFSDQAARQAAWDKLDDHLKRLSP